MQIVPVASTASVGLIDIKSTALNFVPADVICSRWQITSTHLGCGKVTRRANHQKSVQTISEKYSAFAVGQIISTSSAVSCPPEGRFAIVTKRWARDAMDALASGAIVSLHRAKTPKRTAKSCGPDTRCWCQVCGKYPADDGDNKEFAHRGDHEVSRQTIARGK